MAVLRAQAPPAVLDAQHQPATGGGLATPRRSSPRGNMLYAQRSVAHATGEDGSLTGHARRTREVVVIGMVIDDATYTTACDRLKAGLQDISKLVDSDMPGWSRPVFSDPYSASRSWIARRMSEAGLHVDVDAAGNIIGTRRGTSGGSPIMTGSHTDTVRGGGRFDGIVGVLAAIEVARILREKGELLKHNLVIVDFLGEEANDYGVSCLGSRALAGKLSADHMNFTNGHDMTLGRQFERCGLNPSAALKSRWAGNVHAFLELHVEQGPILESRGLVIGVVTAIAGIERLTARFAGRADHAGTMPMRERCDALAAAAEAVLTIEREGCSASGHGVTTTGRLESSPGSFNVIPDRAQLWAEMRSVDRGWLQGARARLINDIVRDAERRGVGVDLEWLNDQDPVPTPESMQDLISRTVDEQGFEWAAVPSGAGHDSAHMPALGPVGMIFIPSRGGRSHCPEEWTDMEDIGVGMRILCHAIINADRQPTLTSNP